MFRRAGVCKNTNWSARRRPIRRKGGSAMPPTKTRTVRSRTTAPLAGAIAATLGLQAPGAAQAADSR
jgi:hypothetical protein